MKRNLSCAGTTYYLAPEYYAGEITHKTDVWSVGVILYMLLTGCPPFNGLSDADIIKKVRSKKFLL